jgi:hypothetical protein
MVTKKKCAGEVDVLSTLLGRSGGSDIRGPEWIMRYVLNFETELNWRKRGTMLAVFAELVRK